MSMEFLWCKKSVQVKAESGVTKSGQTFGGEIHACADANMRPVQYFRLSCVLFWRLKWWADHMLILFRGKFNYKIEQKSD